MTFILVLFLWIFSVCVHEFAHAWVAYEGGDTSVREKGYLSMNPLKYLDPMTSVILPVLVLLMGGLGLPGAAVYIDRHALRSKYWESGVSLAGPAANLAQLFLLSLLLRHTGLGSSEFGPALAFLGLLQASAVVLNLLPLPGLDGYGILSPHLPDNMRDQFDQVARYGIWVLLALFFLVPPFAQGFWNVVWGLSDLAGIPSRLAEQGYRDFRFW